MKRKIKKIYLNKDKRHTKSILGTNLKPRLSIFRSNNHIYAQLIDDMVGNTLLSMSSISKDLNIDLKNKSNLDIAYIIGKILIEKALLIGINTIVFDRDKYRFQGRVKKLIEGALSISNTIFNLKE